MTGLARLRFGVALEPVVAQRLPRARVVHVRVPLRTNVVRLVEQAEADAADLARLRVLAPERAAAGRAEALRPAVLGRELADELLAGEKPERAGREPCLRRGRR